MNKAFIREPDAAADYCPRCGSQGEPVEQATLAAYLAPEDLKRLASSANFCPAPQCEVAYFDVFERVVPATALRRPAWPKDPDAPICACFGLTRADVERDVAEGTVARVRAAVAMAQSPEARCPEQAANGRRCVAYIQRFYMQCRKRAGS